MEDQNDRIANNFINLYESKGFTQHVNVPTHIAGGTLDLVLTLRNVADALPVMNLTVNSNTGTNSDHYLVQFQLPVSLQHTNEPLSEIKELREMSKININEFRLDLEASPINSTSFESVDNAVKLYMDVLECLLDKHAPVISDKLPNGESDEVVAYDFKNFFDQKVKTIYSDIRNESVGIESNAVYTECYETPTKLTDFTPVSVLELTEIIKEMSNKSSALDILPMWLFKNCLPELIGIVHYIVNESLATGCFPSSLKTAMIRPSLKKPSLDSDALKNYRPISTLTYLSKIIEKTVH